MADFQRVFPSSAKLKYVGTEAEAVDGADVVIIATDWPQFRGLEELLKGQKKRPLIMDGRRMLESAYGSLQKAGFKIGEVPIIFADRRLGQSKISRNEIFKAGKTVLRLAIQRPFSASQPLQAKPAPKGSSR